LTPAGQQTGATPDFPDIRRYTVHGAVAEPSPVPSELPATFC